MTASTRPLMALYVAWHPDFAHGAAIAEMLRAHFRRELFESVAGGTGLSVLFRSTPAYASRVPLPIDPAGAETTAIIVLADEMMAGDSDWARYIASLSAQAERHGLAMRLLPVTFNPDATRLAPEQAIRAV